MATPSENVAGRHRLRGLNGFAAPNGRSATRAVVLAGGHGTRLAPYTYVLPKPLMPIGDRAILEIVIEQLAYFGVERVTLSVGHLAHLIEAVIGDGASNEVTISYVREEVPLGTAAPLRLVEGLDEPFIVMNGDVLTTLDYGELVRHHHESGNILTIATKDRPIRIDYGVLHVERDFDGDGVVAYDEKPEMTSTVSMGIYVLDSAALGYIPARGHFDFPQLVQALLAAGERVGAFRYDGLWFDIGRRDDYEQAVSAWLDSGDSRVWMPFEAVERALHP
jgi:NDP-sugar pyrophosphorylase family protein